MMNGWSGGGGTWTWTAIIVLAVVLGKRCMLTGA